jgi:transcriptional regulator with XRE-family HTH domain
MDETSIVEGARTVNVGQNLKRVRKEQRYTQTEIARRCGVTPAAISGLEHDDFTPSTPLLAKLARVLGVSIDELVGESVVKVKTEASRPGTESETVARPLSREDLSQQDPRPGAEAFVERWGEMASAIKTIEIQGSGIRALLRTVQWAVTAEANILFRKFLAVPPYTIRSSDVIDPVPLSDVFNKVYMAAEELRGALRMVDSGMGLHASERHQEEEREYLRLRARARDHVRGDEAWLGEPGEDALGTGALGTIGSSDLEKTRRDQARSN